MCGISGIISKEKLDISWKKTLEYMTHSIIHRGPDGFGNYHSQNLMMGMRRLSIIDLSGGFQPLYNEDKTIILIANGEIYNYVEITQSLKQKGHSFKTQSDCETIIHCYEEYGEAFIHKLRGMFAFCLYDTKKNLVYLVRDRMGEKPLYIYQNKEKVFFSSELRSLVSSKQVPFELDYESIYDYYHFQYVPEPNTPIKNVKKLYPGNLLKVFLNEWKIETKEYWNPFEAKVDYRNPIEAIKEELNEISRIIIRSDVPIGVALSGGLDSSLITAIAHKTYPGNLIAFSVGYPGRPENDERNDAKKLAVKLKIPMVEVELTTKGLVKDFSKMNFMRDDPIADISGYGYYSVNKVSSENNIKVLLQGQGGDELFYGYEWLRNSVKEIEKYKNRPSDFQQFFSEFKSNLPNKNFRDIFSWFKSFGRIRGSYKNFPRSKTHRSAEKFYEFNPDFMIAKRDLHSYLSESMLNSVNPNLPYKYFQHPKKLTNTDILVSIFDCKMYLLENGIAQGDRLSMAFGVELRLPFVDYKLVELVVGLRKNEKNLRDYNQAPKFWLKEAAKDFLEPEVINRPKKGFAPPVLEWHRELFKEYGHQIMNGILVEKDVLNASASVELSSGPFPAGAISPISFKTLVLENWLQQLRELF
ncbi:MAG: asparagine synthase (glutamine-hydrolyzing) [Leptospiraceae bacterium]|nr:asparagine synthase (glutamine-hydrolyzing) [Leptospiraceae bacterium]